MGPAVYAQTLSNDPRRSRSDERTALLRLCEMLNNAAAAGPGSRQAVDAIDAVSKIWAAILEDLTRRENDLPVELRARIISVGIFLLKEVDAIRKGRSTSFDAVRDIISTISEGLA